MLFICTRVSSLLRKIISIIIQSVKKFVHSFYFFGQRLFLPALFSLAIMSGLSACDTLPVSPQESGSAAEPAGKTDTGSDSAGKADSGSDAAATAPAEDLDSETLFNLLAAEFAGNSGNIDASLKYYEKASQEIEDSRIAARAAYIAIYGKDYETALEALNRWAELEPDALDLQKMYAITWLHLKKPEKAVPYIRKVLDQTEGSPADKALAVKALLEKEASNEDAYKVLQILNAGDRKQVHLLVLQSRYAAELKKYDEAIALLDQALETDPQLFEVMLIKARILAVQGKNDEATALVSRVLKEYPDNDNLRLQYARMLLEQGKLEAAIKEYTLLHEKLPENGDISLSLALLYIETRQLDEAVEIFEEMVETDQRTAVAHYYLGRIAQNRGENKQAVAYYLRVKSGEYAYDAQLRIGILLSELGRPDDGLAKLAALAEEQTDWGLRVRAYLAQGEILREQKRYREGVEMYSRALMQKPDDTTLLYARGLMAEKADQLKLAEADLRKVIELDPKSADALNALGYTLADRTDRYEEALGYILRASELVPDDPAILDSLGWVNYRMGRMDEAMKWLSKAFEKLEDAEIAAHYGEVLWVSGQKDKAREIWAKGKKQNAKNPVLIETLRRFKQ